MSGLAEFAINAEKLGLVSGLTPEQVAALSGGLVSIGANVTINSANRSTYDGKTLVWAGAFIVTISSGLENFGFLAETAASGAALIAFGAGVTGINGVTGTTAAGTTITRSSQGFAIYPVATDVYRVTGT